MRVDKIEVSLIFCGLGAIPKSSVAEPHHFYAAPAPALDKNFDAAPVAPASTLQYSKTKFLNPTKA
jgi:hypothetical protein